MYSAVVVGAYCIVFGFSKTSSELKDATYNLKISFRKVQVVIRHALSEDLRGTTPEQFSC
jgi:hypothetical protein